MLDTNEVPFILERWVNVYQLGKHLVVSYPYPTLDGAANAAKEYEQYLAGTYPITITGNRKPLGE
jgi:hypothetical protein